jgi:dipeptidyl aminopeptidase/acylaminoacyl peptidase
MQHLKIFLLLTALYGLLPILNAQDKYMVPGENLVIEGIPALPASLAEEVKKYNESRSASLADWHPKTKEIIISTRFGNHNQLHYVKMPGGARTQLTFFDEPLGNAVFEPFNGNYFLFTKDKGGDEFSQIYRFDMENKVITLLTDGKRSQNGGIRWNRKGNMIAYTSTKRNGKDRDIFVMDPLQPAAERLAVENNGGGWSVADWSADGNKLLLQEGISVNESRIWLADLESGSKTRLVPAEDERTTFRPIGFDADDKGIYLTSNRENEFNRLAYLDLYTNNITYISSRIPWDVGGASLSDDRAKLAFTTNENGLSKLYVLNTQSQQYHYIDAVPAGLIGSLRWSGDSGSLGFTLSHYASSADVYEYDLATQTLIRWTESESGGMDLSKLQEPRLISWTSFDGLTISGYLYEAPKHFTGKRPVIISIHGGPEGQSRPGFIGRNNYFLNEMGISIIYPNIRGSSGYGKTFLDLDNGMKREESIKDIGALLDWIALQPGLDADRVMVTGGSYGGYATLAVAYHYADKIRCAVNIVGISNFNTFLKNTESYRRDLRRVEYGDERDPDMAAFFEQISPLNHAHKMSKPMFIIQGENDPRVPASEAIQMMKKIREAGGTAWFLMAKDEGHGFRKKNNADFQFYATIAFIREFLLE